MKIKAYKSFQKRYQKLPIAIQDKVDRQIGQLFANFEHLSLHTKKIKGKEDIWEVRVDVFLSADL